MKGFVEQKKKKRKKTIDGSKIVEIDF